MALTEAEELELLELEEQEAMGGQGQLGDVDDQAGSSIVRGLGRVATAPFRGYRGVAVGLEKMISSPTRPAEALYRASEAVQPGFRPQGIGETIASIAGESVPLAPVGGALASGKTLAQMAKLGATGAAYSAATQASEEGTISPVETGIAGGIGAAIPAVSGGFKAAYPYVAGKFTKTPSVAYEGLTQAFKSQFPGTEQAIRKTSGSLAKTLTRTQEQASQRIRDIKTFLGISLKPKQAITEMAETSGEARDLGRIAREFRGIRKESAPKITETKELPIVGPSGQPLKVTTQRPGIPRHERLRKLDDLQRDINARSGGSFGEDVYLTKQEISKEARKLGGAGYARLQKSYRQYGSLKNIEDDLGMNLSDETSSAMELEKLIRKTIEKPASLTGTDQRRLEAIQRLERVSGTQIITPLKNEIISSYTNVPLSDFVPKGLLGKLALLKFPAEALTAMAAGSPKVLGEIAKGLYGKPGTIAAGTRAVTPKISSMISEYISRR